MLENQQTLLKNNTPILFDSLSPFDADQDYLKLIRDISSDVKEGNHPENQIHHINELRRMRKYHSDLFIAVFSNILPNYISNLLESSKLDVCLHALTLVSEIFSYFVENEINEWIRDLLPVIIELSTSNFGLISKQSFNALNNLTHQMHYVETLDTLLEIILENDEAQSENACETLIVFITTIEKIVLLHNFFLYDACDSIFKMLQSGNIELIERGKIVLYHLMKKFDSDYFFFLSFFENDDRRKIVEECMIEYRFEKKFTKFETFLKQDF